MRTDGGPVFPVVTQVFGDVEYTGMSLRDLMALQAALTEVHKSDDFAAIAAEAYRFADAMLMERKRANGS